MAHWLRPRHALGDCPAGVDWCSGDDHLCPDCDADYTDRVYEFERDRMPEPGIQGPIRIARPGIGPLDPDQQ